MSVSYVEANSDIYLMVSEVMSKHFSVMASLDPCLEIEVLMAEDDKGKPALKSHGHACAGKIKLVKPEDRAADQGVPDIRIFLDRRRWDKLTSRRRQALLHHELSHVAIRHDKRSGEIKRDDYGRPRLRLKLDDWLLTGFRETAEIFGEDALEIQSLRKVADLLQQPSLLFGDVSAPKAKSGKAKKKAKASAPAEADPAAPQLADLAAGVEDAHQDEEAA